MTREERRASIVEAATPLVEEYGPSVTTKQIAEAAGIAEGTIFRAFDSLQEVVEESARAALSSKRLQKLLVNTTFPGTLDGDTRAAIDAVWRYHDSTQAVIMWSHSSGIGCIREEFTARYAELTTFLSERFATHTSKLVLSVGQFVELIVLLGSGQRRHYTLGLNQLSLDALVDFALHGASKESR